ncbi:hypothetical protein GCM10022419_022330 [Nonomuraea rosea]|uniref:Uncharacterized protein n=1 Tax=Nonomuraea rosea TaxID=638574 RepID=A0ABP6VWQ2_9ACTN
MEDRPGRPARVRWDHRGVGTRTVEHDGLAAVVSTVPLSEYGERALRENLEDLGWLEATARGHHTAVDALARLRTTAPGRLATVFHDDQRVSDLLNARQDEIRRALSQVEGRTEWGIKMYGTPYRMIRRGTRRTRPGRAPRICGGAAADRPGRSAGPVARGRRRAQR